MTDDSGEEVILKALEGYFDNLAGATTNKKKLLEQLVANNDKLAATNEELVAVVKNHPTKIKISNERSITLRKREDPGRQKGRGNQPCAPIAKIKAITNLMPVFN